MELQERPSEFHGELETQGLEVSDVITNTVAAVEELEAMVVAEKREQIITEATKYIWTKYQYQSANPKIWFDCSGFINYVLSTVLKKKNNEIPRSTKMIYQQYGKYRVSPNDAETGDVVLFLNKSWAPYHAEFLTNCDLKNKEITCVWSASRVEKSPDWTIYKPWVDERIREYDKQKYLIIDAKKVIT